MSNKVRRYTELLSLKGLLREKKFSYRTLASKTHMAIATLSDKINGYYVMDADDIERIATVLEIEPKEIPRYFFPGMMRNATKSA
jgi:transcriptional regulator with XRE-family HTH domain